MMKRTCAFVLLLLVVTGTAHAQERVTLDWAMHDAGEVRQVVSNIGAWQAGPTDYPGLINSEYPPNSFEEHMGSGGIWIGTIPQGGANEGDTPVSVTNSWNSSNEFQPGPEPSDSIWIAERGDAPPIPSVVPYPDGERYVPGRDSGYTPISDQDFVMQYNDYGEASLTDQQHEPLYLDVTQTSYAYGSAPLNEFIVYNYHVTPTQHDLEDVYIAAWADANVGYRTGSGYTFATDDYAEYDEEHRLGIGFDAEGGDDGTAYGPVGIRVYPPAGANPDSIEWTFNPYTEAGSHGSPPSRDEPRYRQMAADEIQADQVLDYGAQYMIAFGPFDIEQGDTLRFSIGEAFGKGREGLMETVDQMDFVQKQDFQVPRPPPPPTVSATPTDGTVDLSWRESRERVENYDDPNRADSVEQPFEGYRVWKSTQTKDGPWTLLGTFDVPDNEFESNSGLRYQYTDRDLVNNVEYFYAVTAFSKKDTTIDFPSQSTSRSATAQRVIPGTGPQDVLDSVAVVPNPYRGDIRYQDYDPPWEKPPGTRERWLEQDRRLQFINLPEQARIKIYTLDGVHVQTLRHSSTRRGFEDWDMISRAGQAIASGIYLYTVENVANGNATTGKFVVIK